MELSGWFGVRCLFTGDRDENTGAALYEERITVWPADDAETAIRLAEADAAEYAEAVGWTYLGLAQSYLMAGELAAGAEVFSLIRESGLPPTEYVNTYFDTGAELQVTD
jgi:lipoprotein NlpI